MIKFSRFLNNFLVYLIIEIRKRDKNEKDFT